jgi:2-C-methyl-D-erythritol 4-phosphate cytidylyltransferase
VTPRLISEVLTAAVQWGAAVAALPATDTVKLSKDMGETLSSTLPRENVYLVQTPQAFHRDVLTAAHRRARKENYQSTDDSSLVEWNRHPVRIIPGDPGNIKITTLDDLEHARWILSSRNE